MADKSSQSCGENSSGPCRWAIADGRRVLLDALVGRDCTYCDPSDGLYPRVVFIPIWRDRFRDTKFSGGVECGWRGGRKRHRRFHLLYRVLPGAGQRAFAGPGHHHSDKPIRCHQFVFRHGDDRKSDLRRSCGAGGFRPNHHEHQRASPAINSHADDLRSGDLRRQHLFHLGHRGTSDPGRFGDHLSGRQRGGRGNGLFDQWKCHRCDGDAALRFAIRSNKQRYAVGYFWYFSQRQRRAGVKKYHGFESRHGRTLRLRGWITHYLFGAIN